jgi:hypothetical protein|tara:strand:+ start:215 stop:1267 length:1053 start_codon:yes stop_codon:yes gene_type:complete
MRKLLMSLAMVLGMTSTASADYTFVVPQKPGGGTTVWTEIVAKELAPFLGEKIIIKTIPGARDIPGFNKFHNDLQKDDKTVMVSHGGNGVSFLQENVDYNYADYTSIGLMNLDIIAGISKDFKEGDKISFAAGSGMVPEAFAMTMLLCGPDLTMDQYAECFKKNVIWVAGMSGGERRLAFKRGELNGTRENPAAYKKHVASNPDAKVWFTHGILDANSASHTDDPNYPNMQFEILFKNKYGVAPSGEFYDAYKLVKSFRDGMQKAIWVRKDNPNAQKLQDALTAMSKDATAIANIQKKVGKYEWKIGVDGNRQRDVLMTFITKDALRNLVKFNTEALGLKSVYKENLIAR